MSAITPGSVVDVATPRGLRTVIVAASTSTDIEGWEVSSRDHTSVTRAYAGLKDEALFPHDGERALVIPLQDGGEVVAFVTSDDNSVTIYSPYSRPRSAKREPTAVVKALVSILKTAENHQAAEDINKYKDFYTNHIAQVLNLKE